MEMYLWSVFLFFFSIKGSCLSLSQQPYMDLTVPLQLGPATDILGFYLAQYRVLILRDQWWWLCVLHCTKSRVASVALALHDPLLDFVTYKSRHYSYRNTSTNVWPFALKSQLHNSR